MYNNMKPNPFGVCFTGKFTLKHIHLQIKRGKTYPAESLYTACIQHLISERRSHGALSCHGTFCSHSVVMGGRMCNFAI